ncbi:MAG TPA: N-acetylmuramic acid 6-phosphate etherase [Bacteroidia bacterium]|nr:N-acetylmuramic acid 6-phosphate etherase [Bacteroidia bacterium]
MTKITESDSLYNNLEKMSIEELLYSINAEDKKVPDAVENIIPQLVPLIKTISEKMKNNGRLFYIGAGTSGRLGIVDASECPPTYGVEYGKVIGIIAGGNKAITRAVEFAEDDEKQGWKDLKKHKVSINDVVIGLSASGTTPYVIGALKECKKHHITTGSISCNPNAEISKHADYPIEVIVGPEFVTGSTRMKAGTAQKLILNMISTSVMIQLGRVKDNKMIDMQLTNAKLIDRGTKILMKNTGIKDYEYLKNILLQTGSVRKSMEYLNKNNKEK